MGHKELGNNSNESKGIVFVTEVALAITMFLALGPFFVWQNFLGGVGYLVYQFFQVVSMILLCVVIYLRRSYLIKVWAAFAMLGLFLFLSCFTGIKGGTYLPFALGNVVTFVTFSLLIMTDEICLANSFDKLNTILAFVLAYTVFIYVLVLIGIPVPVKSLESAEAGRVAFSGQSYLNYMGCLFIKSPTIDRLDRFSSVFNEPGVVGTVSAIMLSANRFNFKQDKRNLIYLVAGIVSLSLAFFVMCMIYLLINAIKNGATKVACQILIFATVFFVFLNIDFSNQYVSTFQERLKFGETQRGSNKRITDLAQSEYDDFLRDDFKVVLLGYGKPFAFRDYSVWQGSAIYKRQIYQFGILGVGLYLLWIIIFPYKCLKSDSRRVNSDIILYIIVFITTFYQRPSLTSIHYLYFLIAGCAFTKHGSKILLTDKMKYIL